MTYRQPFLTFVAAAFGLCFVGNASALIRGGYGGKDLQTGKTLVCEADPTDPRIDVGEILFPEVAFGDEEPESVPDFELKGQWVCWEAATPDPEDPNPDLSPTDLDGDGIPDEFVVEVTQETDLANEPGLSVTCSIDAQGLQPCPPGNFQNGTDYWMFTFIVANGSPAETLLFNFVPKDPVTGTFTTGDPDDEQKPNFSPACLRTDLDDPPTPPFTYLDYFNPCFVKVGTPPAPKAGDFPDNRDIDGNDSTDLAKGEVFKYSVQRDTSTDPVTVIPGDLFDGSCTSGTFDGDIEVNDGCAEGKGKNAEETRGKVAGIPEYNADVEIQPESEDNFLARNDTGDMSVEVLNNEVVTSVSNLSDPRLGGTPEQDDPPNDPIPEVPGTDLNDITLVEVGCTGDEAEQSCFADIQDLVNRSANLKNANPGDKVFLPFEALLPDGTRVGGSDFVEIVLPVRVDYRPGCGNNLALNNPNGSDPVAVLGGNVGDYDYVDVNQIDTTSLFFIVKDKDTGNPVGQPVGLDDDNVHYTDASGTNCAGTPGDDGNGDGHVDAVFRIDVTELGTVLNMQPLVVQYPDGEMVPLHLVGQLLDGARIEGTAWVKVNR